LAAVVLLLLLLGLAVFLVSCGRTPPSPPATTEPANVIGVSGAWALHPMMVLWAEEYRKLHPKVQVGLWATGSGRGITEALGGIVEIAMVSRGISPDEEKRGAFWMPVVRDAVVVVANARNPVATELASQGLTREQCAALWLEAKDVTWGSLVSRPEMRQKVHV